LVNGENLLWLRAQNLREIPRGHNFSYGWQNKGVTTPLTDEDRAARLSALTALLDLMRPSVQADGGDFVLM
jgi:hypothetical protein